MLAAASDGCAASFESCSNLEDDRMRYLWKLFNGCELEDFVNCWFGGPEGDRACKNPKHRRSGPAEE